MKIVELMSLKGRRALITGAAGGLGIVIAETLAELGCDLILVDRKQDDGGHHDHQNICGEVQQVER